MLDILKDWYHRHFTDPQTVILVLVLLAAFAFIMLFGDILAPVLVALIMAYLLEGVVQPLTRLGINRKLAIIMVLMVAILLALVLLFGLAPILSNQVTELVRGLPGMISAGQEQLMRLPELYPEVITEKQINELISGIRADVGKLGQDILSFSIARLGTVVMIGIYAVLVPMIVFFALKDKDLLLSWFARFMPTRSELSFQVWREVDIKIANYIRGKFVEISIVWVTCYIIFALMGLNYSLLLSFLVGLSVIIPFVGAVAVTVPIALIAFFQWGLEPRFWYVMIIYQVLQILDGNVLVPLLFSEVVNLHPLAIITAVLFFGGLWGIWGVFFAIPLATLIQAVLNAWPRRSIALERKE